MPHRTALVFDYGRRRIGVAVANRLGGTASAVAVVTARDGQPDWPAIDALVRDWGPDILVSGLPYNADGSESDMTNEVKKFAALLTDRYALEVTMVDERLSSTEAESILREQRRAGTRRRRVRKGDVDRTAAVLIAESWLRNADGPDRSNDG